MQTFLSLSTLAVLGLLATTPCSPAFGQLRSGKVERQLYQTTQPTTQAQSPPETVASRPAAVAGVENRNAAGRRDRNQAVSGARRRQMADVIPAGYSQDLAPAESILENSTSPMPRSIQETTENLHGDAMGMNMLSPATPMSHVPRPHSSGHFAGGGASCDSCGCDSCNDFSQLAPTSSQACPPGCGPLMALWYRMRIRGEAPMYWRRAAGPPALATTGELGLATTTTLLGNGVLNEDLQVGGRITLSTWIDPAEEFGVQFRYWNAGDQDDTFAFDSSTHPILARPFFNTSVANAFVNDTQLISVPNDLSGGLQVESTSAVQGLEIQLRRRLYQDRFTRIDWMSGYQHISINEGMVISSNSTVIGTDNAISVRDSFFTDNSFHGGSYGFISTRNIARWQLETMFRLGMGNLRREVSISGSTTTSGGGQTNTVSEGLLARDTNSRHIQDDTFVVVPEVGFNLAYTIRPGWDFTVGYNYLLIPKVAQASQQINDNLAVNLSAPLVGQLDPGFEFDERSYWLHSLGLGLQVRY